MAFSTSLRMNSGREGTLSSLDRSSSIHDKSSGGMRTVTGVELTGGRPIRFP